MMRIGSVWLFSAALIVGACDKGKDAGGGGGKPPITQKDGAEGLKEFFAATHTACTKKDFARGKAMVMSVIPNKDQLKKMFKDDAPQDSIDKLAEQFKELPPSDEKAACVFAPEGRTEIRVHASTVEDLAAYKEGTPAFEEFPGGAKKLAETVLKPGTTFYEVEVTEPGKDSGTKYHMFYWDGGQWRMMGPAWRVFKSE